MLLMLLDVTGVEPLMHPLETAGPFRRDEVHEFPPTANGEPKVLEHAPEVENGGFKVPPIL